MGKSASVLGVDFGRTAREMNLLLKEHGYLEGSPGAYRLTEKGKQYAEEQYHSRGTGGYAQYNPSWETRTWNEETSAVLAADMKAQPIRREPEESRLQQNNETLEGEDPFVDYDTGSDEALEMDPRVAIITGGILIGGVIAAPYVKSWWDETVRPAAKNFRNKVGKRQSDESED